MKLLCVVLLFSLVAHKTNCRNSCLLGQNPWCSKIKPCFLLAMCLADSISDLIRLARYMEEKAPLLLDQPRFIINHLLSSERAFLKAKGTQIKQNIDQNKLAECSQFLKDIDKILLFQVDFHYSFGDCTYEQELKTYQNMVEALAPIRKEIAELIKNCNAYTEICRRKYEDIDLRLNMMYNGFVDNVNGVVVQAEKCIRDRGRMISNNLENTANVWKAQCYSTTP